MWKSLVYNELLALPNDMHFYSFSTFLLIGGDIVDLVKETGAVAQAVLLFLLVFSLISWSIILSKWSAIRRARVQSGRFLRAFRRVTPFIGLFGTVWGIIDAFHGLGTSGQATLRAVAPGISEALITTAAGLVTAIPAVIAYNLIGGSIRDFAARCDDFSLEMLNAVERQAPVARAPEEVRR